MKNTFKVAIEYTEYRFQFTQKQFDYLHGTNGEKFDSLYDDIRRVVKDIETGYGCFWIRIPKNKNERKTLNKIKAVFKRALTC